MHTRMSNLLSDKEGRNARSQIMKLHARIRDRKLDDFWGKAAGVTAAMLVFHSKAIETWKSRDENKGLVMAALELSEITIPKNEISQLEKSFSTSCMKICKFLLF